jgi:hypothetical protein
MRTLRIHLPYLAVLVFVTLAAPAAAEIALSSRGLAKARIVVAADASEPDRTAAAELGLFLHIVTGGDFPVTTEGAGGGTRLLVGAGAARWAQPPFEASSLAPEEIVVRTAGDDLILAGGGPRGTIYAVYTFLEDVVGCRWWTRTASHMPFRPNLSVERLDIRFKPPLEYREPFWYTAFDPIWAARNKANGISAGGDDLHGGRQVYEGFVHTFYPLIPPEKYFEAHPDWFSEIKGVRVSKDAQLCLTNEEMRRELVRNLRQRLRANPKATIASVSQNDCFNPCTCPRCRAVDEEEGGPSGTLLRFVNAVAADLKDEFPNVAFDTLAYQYTRKPPKHVRPRPNVIVRLCSIECGFARPLDDPINKAFLDDLDGWSKIAGRLYIWDYTTDFAHYIQPQPNYGVLAPNIRLFVARNVRGVFEQGAFQSWGSEMAELRAWMLAKLLWNPALDAGRLRREFLRGYYGPAAGPVEDYLALLEAAVLKAGDPLGCYSPPTAKFLTLETLTAAWGLLEKAERKTAGTLEYAARIRLAKLPAAYVVLARWEDFKGDGAKKGLAWVWPREREELLKWFLAEARKAGVTMISEGRPFEDWAAKDGRRP